MKGDIETKKILSKIRECIDSNSATRIPSIEEYNRKKMITEESEKKKKALKITKSTPQFGDVRVSQEDALIKTIGENISLSDDGLVFYPENKDLVLTGSIKSLKIAFQFKYNDPSGDGCYIWANGLQLTDANNRTIGKIRDCFVNWKNSLIENGDLIEKLDKAASNI